MAIDFPALRPTQRRFAPGVLPQTVARTINQRTVRRPLANRSGGAVLELRYENITDDEVDAIRQAWKAAKGRYDTLTLPSEVWAGDGPLEIYAMLLPDSSGWRFSGDVEVEWVKRGRARVRVRLVNYSRSALALPDPPDPGGGPPVTGVTACLYLSEVTPIFTQQLDAYSMFSPDGSRVYTVTSVQGIELTTPGKRMALLAHDVNGNLLWAQEDTQAGGISGVNPGGVAVLPDGNIVAVYMLGTRNYTLLYKYTPAGAMIQQTAFDPTGVPGFGASTNGVAYNNVLDRIVLNWVGIGIYLFDPVTLQPTASRLVTQSAQFSTALYAAANNRFICIGQQDNNELALYEYDATLTTTFQKYTYLTSVASTYVRWRRYCVDQFGAVYCLYIDTSASAQPGAFT